MRSWIQSVLQTIAALMISPTVPGVDVNQDWVGATEWKAEQRILVYRAESERIIQKCKQNSNAFLQTPVIPQGGHQFFLDGRLILSKGDRTFVRPHTMYSSASLPCKEIIEGKKLVWETFTATHSLAQLSRFPELHEGRSFGKFFEETLNIVTCGIMGALGIICFIIYLGKVEKSILLSLLIGCVAYCISFACQSPDAFMINLDPLTLQQISDSFIWIGLLCTAFLLYGLGYCGRAALKFIVTIGCIAVMIIFLSANLDHVQAGSNVALLGNLLFYSSTLIWSIFSRLKKLSATNTLLKLLSLSSFTIGGVNDVLLVQGIIHSIPLFSIGVLFSTVILAFAVNELIKKTYQERDYLRENLEIEVERKTTALIRKSSELEQTLVTLKSAQADLVQSEKLAALGTLSAGIAHEINNALNYVNGGIEPIRQIINKDSISETDRTRAGKLLKLMREGLSLTFDIIVNLKRHTSTANAEPDELKLKEATEGVLILLKSKLAEIDVQMDIASEFSIVSHRAGFSQVLMNLIANSVDAIETACEKDPTRAKTIRISAEKTDQGVSLIIADSGTGIPPEIRAKIFDPFFTTKAVGKGTGLGLHIAFAEMKKIGGRIELRESAQGDGATFALHFPSMSNLRAA